MMYEVYDKFNECKWRISNVEKVIEKRHTFQFKFNDGKYSNEYLKGMFKYCEI